MDPIAAVLHLRDSVNLAQKADQELPYFLKSNFCITKETGEHKSDPIGIKCIRIRVRKSLMAQTSHCILLSISRARSQPRILEVLNT